MEANVYPIASFFFYASIAIFAICLVILAFSKDNSSYPCSLFDDQPTHVQLAFSILITSIIVWFISGILTLSLAYGYSRSLAIEELKSRYNVSSSQISFDKEVCLDQGKFICNLWRGVYSVQTGESGEKSTGLIQYDTNGAIVE
jgi:hypothetical protein